MFQSFLGTDDFRDCLIDAVNRGGDADTTGAIAEMLAGRYGLGAIPNAWLKMLDANIRHSCEEQAGKLIRLAVKP